MRRPSLALLVAPLALACHAHHSEGTVVVPSVRESERNDAPLEANHFGLLRAGDHLFVDGFVRDDAFDPFDGFAFTAAEPLHVDFLLHHGSPRADLDVCLYDPLLDETLACWATGERPEVGGVDVFAGGFDFHLVVESFSGDSSYALELVVTPLYALSDGRARLGASGARAEHAPAALAGYRRLAAEPEPRLLLEQVIEVDPESGLVLVRQRRAPWLDD